MIRKTLREAAAILLLALFVSMLHHTLAPSGITVFKSRTAESSSPATGTGGQAGR